MTDCISLLYTENDNELPGHIKPGVVYDKSRYDNDVTDLTCVVYAEKQN